MDKQGIIYITILTIQGVAVAYLGYKGKKNEYATLQAQNKQSHDEMLMIRLEAHLHATDTKLAQAQETIFKLEEEVRQLKRRRAEDHIGHLRLIEQIRSLGHTPIWEMK